MGFCITKANLIDFYKKSDADLKEILRKKNIEFDEKMVKEDLIKKIHLSSMLFLFILSMFHTFKFEINCMRFAKPEGK